MRFLAWHVDYFKCCITERGRSSLVEEYDDPETVAEDDRRAGVKRWLKRHFELHFVPLIWLGE